MLVRTIAFCYEMEVVYMRLDSTSPKGTGLFHEKVVQIPMEPTSASLLSLPTTCMALWVFPYNQLTEEENFWVWFPNSSALEMKVLALKLEAQHYCAFLGHPWRTAVKDNPPGRQYLDYCTWLYILLRKKEMVRGIGLYWFMTCGQWFGWMVRDFKRTWLWMVPKEWPQFNNQIYKTTYSGNSSQPLSLSTLAIVQWAHEQNVWSYKDGSYARAQQLGFISPRRIWL